jgi:hypothetical protein
LQKRRDRLQVQLDELECDESMVEEDSDPGRGGAGGGRGGSGRGGSGGGSSGGSSGSGPGAPGGGGELSGQGGGAGRNNPTGNTNNEQNVQKCRQLFRQRDVLDRQIEKLRKELEELGVALQQQDAAAAPVDPMQQDELVIWAHDLDVQPGRTYRYRFIVKVCNPFFGRKPLLTKEQQHYAEELTIASQTSEWSEPVEAQPPLVDFVMKAWPPSDANAGRATLQVFKFEDGRWWKEDFTAYPGDLIGSAEQVKTGDGSEVEIDFSTDWFVLDVIRDVRAEGDRLQIGMGAVVILQNLRTGEISELRSPAEEAADPRRDDLTNQVELSRPPTAVASTRE